MASQYPPKKNTEYTHFFSLFKNDGTIIANPGAYTKKVSVDGAAIADITASVTEEDTNYGQLSIVLTAGEMNGDSIWGMIQDDTAGCVPHIFVFKTTAYTLDEIMAELAKIPKSDSNVSWNATALGAINAEVDTALNTAIPGSPTADSINERIVNMEGTAIPAIKTVVDTIQADTDLLDDAIGGLADLHTDIAAVKTVVDTIQADTDLLDDAAGGLADIHTDIGTALTNIAAVKTVVDTIQADTDLLDDVSGGLADIHTDIAAVKAETALIVEDTNELQAEFVDGGRLDLLIDQILADTNELQLDWANGGRLDLLIDAHTTEIAKIPKSDSNVTWNATALASINAEVDTALNTAIPGSPTADSINERIATMDTTAIPAIKTVVDTIQADTDLLDDAIGGLADIHADIASARSEIATVDGHVSDVFDDVGDLQSSVDDILADTNELQIDNVDGGRTDLLIDSIITKVDHLAVATLGLGACTWVYTLTDSVTALPIEGAEVWVTTDVAGLNVVAHGYTNASGIVTFYLDAGTNYFWRQHGNYTFTNPDTEIVS